MRIEAKFSLVLMSAMTDSICILAMTMKRNDGIQPLGGVGSLPMAIACHMVVQLWRTSISNGGR
ncbi:hypothetical protein CP880_10740 [Cutibacterium namnetense]|nr:hypothetical protein CP880_10740 [Cutibacterium namnetense]